MVERPGVRIIDAGGGCGTWAGAIVGNGSKGSMSGDGTWQQKAPLAVDGDGFIILSPVTASGQSSIVGCSRPSIQGRGKVRELSSTVVATPEKAMTRRAVRYETVDSNAAGLAALATSLRSAGNGALEVGEEESTAATDDNADGEGISIDQEIVGPSPIFTRTMTTTTVRRVRQKDAENTDVGLSEKEGNESEDYGGKGKEDGGKGKEDGGKGKEDGASDDSSSDDSDGSSDDESRDGDEDSNGEPKDKASGVEDEGREMETVVKTTAQEIFLIGDSWCVGERKTLSETKTRQTSVLPSAASSIPKQLVHKSPKTNTPTHATGWSIKQVRSRQRTRGFSIFAASTSKAGALGFADEVEHTNPMRESHMQTQPAARAMEFAVLSFLDASSAKKAPLSSPASGPRNASSHHGAAAAAAMAAAAAEAPAAAGTMWAGRAGTEAEQAAAAGEADRVPRLQLPGGTPASKANSVPMSARRAQKFPAYTPRRGEQPGPQQGLMEAHGYRPTKRALEMALEIDWGGYVCKHKLLTALVMKCDGGKYAVLTPAKRMGALKKDLAGCYGYIYAAYEYYSSGCCIDEEKPAGSTGKATGKAAGSMSASQALEAAAVRRASLVGSSLGSTKGPGGLNDPGDMNVVGLPFTGVSLWPKIGMGMAAFLECVRSMGLVKRWKPGEGMSWRKAQGEHGSEHGNEVQSGRKGSVVGGEVLGPAAVSLNTKTLIQWFEMEAASAKAETTVEAARIATQNARAAAAAAAKGGSDAADSSAASKEQLSSGVDVRAFLDGELMDLEFAKENAKASATTSTTDPGSRAAQQQLSRSQNRNFALNLAAEMDREVRQDEELERARLEEAKQEERAAAAAAAGEPAKVETGAAAQDAFLSDFGLGPEVPSPEPDPPVTAPTPPPTAGTGPAVIGRAQFMVLVVLSAFRRWGVDMLDDDDELAGDGNRSKKKTRNDDASSESRSVATVTSTKTDEDDDNERCSPSVAIGRLAAYSLVTLPEKAMLLVRQNLFLRRLYSPGVSVVYRTYDRLMRVLFAVFSRFGDDADFTANSTTRKPTASAATATTPRNMPTSTRSRVTFGVQDGKDSQGRKPAEEDDFSGTAWSGNTSDPRQWLRLRLRLEGWLALCQWVGWDDGQVPVEMLKLCFLLAAPTSQSMAELTSASISKTAARNSAEPDARFGRTAAEVEAAPHGEGCGSQGPSFPVKDHWPVLSYLDFLEAVARLADERVVPDLQHLQASGAPNIVAFYETVATPASFKNQVEMVRWGEVDLDSKANGSESNGQRTHRLAATAPVYKPVHNLRQQTNFSSDTESGEAGADELATPALGATTGSGGSGHLAQLAARRHSRSNTALMAHSPTVGPQMKLWASRAKARTDPRTDPLDPSLGSSPKAGSSRLANSLPVGPGQELDQVHSAASTTVAFRDDARGQGTEGANDAENAAGGEYYGQIGGRGARGTIVAIGAAVASAVATQAASGYFSISSSNSSSDDDSTDQDDTQQKEKGEGAAIAEAMKIVEGTARGGCGGGRLLRDGTDEATARSRGTTEIVPRVVAGAEGSREWAAARNLLRQFMHQQLGEEAELESMHGSSSNTGVTQSSDGDGLKDRVRQRKHRRWWEREHTVTNDGQASAVAPFMVKLGKAAASKQPGLHSKLQSMLTLSCACIDARLHDGEGNGILDMAELACALGVE
jgi:hypothetical protein